jgi:hypothetical protein
MGRSTFLQNPANSQSQRRGKVADPDLNSSILHRPSADPEQRFIQLCSSEFGLALRHRTVVEATGPSWQDRI